MNDEYKIEFYKNSKGFSQPENYLLKIKLAGERAKIAAFIKFLLEKSGYLSEPYSKHIDGSIRELRIKRHRIFYAPIEDKIIILLYAFYKNTEKTPVKFIIKAKKYLDDYLRRLRLEKN
jgi:phage-related protein